MSLRPLCFGLGVAAALSLLAGAAQARQPTAAETQALQAAVAKLDAATKNGDMNTVAGLMSPKLMAALAKQADTTPANLRVQMIAGAAAAMKQVKITNITLDWVHVAYPDASKTLVVAMIPTKTDLLANGIIAHSNSTTLGVLDSGTWSVLAVSDPSQMQSVAQAYPELAALKLPAANSRGAQ